MKTLKMLLQNDKEQFVIPKSVQDVIPIQRIWNNGIFLVGNNKYTQTFKFTDINYALLSQEDREKKFLDYSALLNSFDSGVTTKITVILKRMNKKKFEQEILLPFKNDGLDIYRQEYNQNLLEKINGASGMIKELYCTISINKKSYEEAQNYFRRVFSDLSNHFTAFGSKFTVLNAEERLQILHDFFHIGEDSDYKFSLQDSIKLGHNFKDYICPSSFSFKKDFFEMGNNYGRLLFLKDYANYIHDNIIAELTEINQNMIISIDIIPISTDEAVKEIENKLLGIESNITNWQRKQNANNNFSATIPYSMEQQRNETKEFLDDLTTRDQRMMLANLTIALVAEKKSDLDNGTESITATARKHLCQIVPLNYQQMDGLKTVLPIGVRKIQTFRTLTTESLAALNPFHVQEIMNKNGLYYGENAISHNLIMINQEDLLNQSSFILGVPGSGKSFSAKEIITFLTLSTEDDIIICDPEGEYSALIEALGGEVINISSNSSDHINALDMVEGYSAEGNPIADKSEFILSLFEQLYTKSLSPKEKSIIDRCITSLYSKYSSRGETPTLLNLKEELLTQPEDEAKDLALALELFTSGSLNIFAHKTNVDVHNRIISYNIYQLGKQLKILGVLVIIDAIINRVADNYKKGKRTHLFIDEIQILLEDEYSSVFFENAWRQFRKRGAYPVASTQNADYVWASPEARSMLSNSELIVMFNQSSSDRKELAKLLNISKEQLAYITNSDAGCGLIRSGNTIIPFINHFPQNTRLYKLMTTKPKDRK